MTGELDRAYQSLRGKTLSWATLNRRCYRQLREDLVTALIDRVAEEEDQFYFELVADLGGRFDTDLLRAWADLLLDGGRTWDEISRRAFGDAVLSLAVRQMISRSVAWEQVPADLQQPLFERISAMLSLNEVKYRALQRPAHTAVRERLLEHYSARIISGDYRINWLRGRNLKPFGRDILSLIAEQIEGGVLLWSDVNADLKPHLLRVLSESFVKGADYNPLFSAQTVLAAEFSEYFAETVFRRISGRRANEILGSSVLKESILSAVAAKIGSWSGWWQNRIWEESLIRDGVASIIAENLLEGRLEVSALSQRGSKLLRRQIVKAVAENGHPRTVDVLLRFLDDSDSAVVSRTAELLAGFDDRRVLIHLALRLERGARDGAGAMANALLRLPGGVAALRGLVRRACTPAARIQIVRAMVRAECKEAAGELVSAFHSENSRTVREEIVSAIGVLGTAEQADMLMRVLMNIRGEHSKVRQRARQALASVGIRETTKVVSELYDRASRAQRCELRKLRELVPVLGDIAEETMGPILAPMREEGVKTSAFSLEDFLEAVEPGGSAVVRPVIEVLSHGGGVSPGAFTRMVLKAEVACNCLAYPFLREKLRLYGTKVVKILGLAWFLRELDLLQRPDALCST